MCLRKRAWLSIHQRQLSIVYCQLSIVNCLLNIVYCQLSIVYCLSSIVYRPLTPDFFVPPEKWCSRGFCSIFCYNFDVYKDANLFFNPLNQSQG